MTYEQKMRHIDNVCRAVTVRLNECKYHRYYIEYVPVFDGHSADIVGLAVHAVDSDTMRPVFAVVGYMGEDDEAHIRVREQASVRVSTSELLKVLCEALNIMC